MTRFPILRASALLALAPLAACVEARPLDRPELLAAIGPAYRTTIVAWAKGFFAEPGSLRAGRISTPIQIQDRRQNPMWLVCVEVDARTREGAYLGPQRFALGFNGPTLISSPQRRTANALSSADCDRFPLAYAPFPELERIDAPAPRRR